MNALASDPQGEPQAAPWRNPAPWYLRVIDTVSTYLPLLLMAVLALGTWWLVKNTPLFETDRAAAPLRHEPDYTMTQFMVQRFSANGAMRVQIEGDLMRHYPDTDTFEIDKPRIRSIGEDGRVTTATARLALSNRDGSEVQLTDAAHVVREATATEAAIDFRGDFLHCFQYTERVRSHLPVVVTQGGSEIRADSMAYDNLSRVLDLKGHVRGVLSPPGTPRREQAPMTAPLLFVTGASSGIGQALAARFHRAGYRLALVARRAAEVQAWAEAQGFDAASFAVYAADVRDVNAIVEAGRACVLSQGVPDVVIANAGVSIGMDTAEFDDLEVMRATFETNNLGMAATFHPFVAAMGARRSGTLVGIASVAAIRGLPGHGAYCASKAAVVNYCESLRGELRANGVAVVTVVPGYIDTPLTRGNPYGMPFLMPVDAFADQAFEAIVSGVSYRVIPWQMGVVAKLMRMLPNAVYDKLVAGRGRKPRQKR